MDRVSSIRLGISDPAASAERSPAGEGWRVSIQSFTVEVSGSLSDRWYGTSTERTETFTVTAPGASSAEVVGHQLFEALPGAYPAPIAKAASVKVVAL